MCNELKGAFRVDRGMQISTSDGVFEIKADTLAVSHDREWGTVKLADGTTGSLVTKSGKYVEAPIDHSDWYF